MKKVLKYDEYGVAIIEPQNLLGLNFKEVDLGSKVGSFHLDRYYTYLYPGVMFGGLTFSGRDNVETFCNDKGIIIGQKLQDGSWQIGEC